MTFRTLPSTWDQEKASQLTELVKEHSNKQPIPWDLISERLERSKSSCLHCYYKFIRKGAPIKQTLPRRIWSKEENARLIELVDGYLKTGIKHLSYDNWEVISKILKTNRSPLSCRVHYRDLLKKRKQEDNQLPFTRRVRRRPAPTITPTKKGPSAFAEDKPPVSFLQLFQDAKKPVLVEKGPLPPIIQKVLKQEHPDMFEKKPPPLADIPPPCRCLCETDAAALRAYQESIFSRPLLSEFSESTLPDFEQQKFPFTEPPKPDSVATEEVKPPNPVATEEKELSDLIKRVFCYDPSKPNPDILTEEEMNIDRADFV